MYSKVLYCLLITLMLIECVYLKPVTPEKKKKTEKEVPKDDKTSPEEAERELEFGRYLQQVVQALEGDPELSQRLKDVSEEELKTGQFSNYLKMAHQDTRTKLDEFKRMEVDRVRKMLHNQQRKKESSQHLDIHVPTFEVDDMQKLIMAAKSHYDEIEKQQEEEFKRHEMEKKLKHDVELNHLSGEEKKKTKEEDEKLKKLMEEEAKQMKHPGSKHQLEDVYKERNLDPRDMDPNTLFQMLDLNNDNILEADELRMLFLPEIHELKHWNETEKQHELDRYEHHYFKQYDTNKDGLIEKNEWDSMMNDPEYDRDDGWNADYDPYTDDEFEIFRKEHENEFEDEFLKEHPDAQRLPPHFADNQLPQHHPNQIPQQQQQHQQYQNQPPAQYQANQIPQQPQQNLNMPRNHETNQIPRQQQNQQQNKAPQQQQQQNQVPQQQQQNQIPQQQQQNQVPQQQRQNQVPQQQQQQNQVPQQQQHRVPQQQH